MSDFTSTTRRTTAARLVTCLCLMAAFGVAALGTHEWLSVPTPVPAAGAALRQEGDAQVLLLVLRPAGFEPSEVTLPQGKYLLVVQNRTGLRGFALQFDRDGGRLHEVRLPARKLDWNGHFDLTPGDYVLREADHPEWSCRITITPK
ncbi:MAG: hypothetical protein M3444_13340 [Acidobacteriota bacterium]|nr:hypothetical protein [Acidobacteriota bacterium]